MTAHTERRFLRLQRVKSSIEQNAEDSNLPSSYPVDPQQYIKM
jgi:hypothetical protein